MTEEEDLMLLEEYLDGELSAADARAIEERSVHEPELAEELTRLRADRQVRAICWRAMEGDPATVLAVSGRVSNSIERRESFLHLIRGAWIGGAAAACILLGLAVGLVANGAAPVSPTNATHVAAAPQTAADKIVWAGALAPTPQPAGFNVQIRDTTGRVIAVQHFATLEQARQFKQDVEQWQQQEQQVHDGNVTFAADQF